MADKSDILLNEIIKFNNDLQHPETGVLIFIDEHNSFIVKDYGFDVAFEIIQLENTDQILQFFIFKGKQMVNKFQINIPMIISGCILEYGNGYCLGLVCQTIVDEFKSYMERIYGKVDKQDNKTVTSVSVLKCPSCGASIRQGQENCDYCKSVIIFK